MALKAMRQHISNTLFQIYQCESFQLPIDRSESNQCFTKLASHLSFSVFAGCHNILTTQLE